MNNQSVTRPQENVGYDHKFFETVFSFKIILVNNVNACFNLRLFSGEKNASSIS